MGHPPSKIVLRDYRDRYDSSGLNDREVLPAKLWAAITMKNSPILAKWTSVIGLSLVGFYWFYVRSTAGDRITGPGMFLTILVICGILSGQAKLTIQTVIWTLVPGLLTVVFASNVESIAQSSLRNPTTANNAHYASAGGFFLAFFLFWIAGFPDSQNLEIPVRIRKLCQAIVFIFGAVVGCLGAFYASRILGNSNIAASDQLGHLLTCFKYGTLALFALFILRFALPKLIYVMKNQGTLSLNSK